MLAQVGMPSTPPEYAQILGYVLAACCVLVSFVIICVVPAMIREMRDNRKYLQKLVEDSNTRHSETCEAFTTEQRESRAIFTDAITQLQRHNEERTERCFSICQQAIENVGEMIKPKVRKPKLNDGT